MIASVKATFASLLLVTVLTACAMATTPTSIPNPPTLTITTLPTPTVDLSTPTMPATAATSGECRPVMANPLQPESPDGNWSVYDCPESELYITNEDGSKAWYLSYDQLLPDTKNVNVEHWSPDSRYVYLSVGAVHDGPMGLRPRINQLWRLNVETGETFNIFANIAAAAGADYPSSAVISFSPKEKTLLVIDQWHIIPPVIYIYDLEKSQFVQSFRLAGSEKSVTTGSVVWSADEQHFALTSASGGEFEEYAAPGQPPKEWVFSVIVFDLETMTQKAIISEREGLLTRVREITAENIVVIESSHPVKISGTKRDVILEQYDLIKDAFLTPIATP